MKKKIIRGILVIILFPILYVLGSILHGTITDYEPEEITELKVSSEIQLPSIITDSIISVLTWNVGYAGLSADCNIFYPAQGMFRSHGKMIRPEIDVVKRNIAGGIDFLLKHPTDFVLLQEMDIESKRGHHLPMFSDYQKALKNKTSIFAPNFIVQRVPTPLLEPWQSYGCTHSGLASFFNYEPFENTRYQLPGEHPWPDRIFLLDRCLSVHRFETLWGKDLVLINLHNSAYDTGGLLRAGEMNYLKQLVIPEYEKGNYVIVGGDWNTCPPNFPAGKFARGKRETGPGSNIAVDLFPSDWQWLFDPDVPTVRSTNDFYVAEETPQGLIDFFLLSPNCKPVEVNGFDEQYKYSDHQPVRATIQLQK